MASLAGFVGRLRKSLYPPEVKKTIDPVRIGLLGASNIGSMAIIGPSISHPEIVITALAARDQVKADAYAKLHRIPKVHKSYQELIDDPEIDAVYIPLPNGLHYEWAIRSLRAGKHVLLEKPCVSNAQEARKLFAFHSSMPSPRPVLLEAFHNRFHPAWHLFLSLVTPSAVTSATSSMNAPALLFPIDDIRFIYNLSGGCLMDMGPYTVSALRQVFGTEPQECMSAEPKIMPPAGDQKCDQAFKASWSFPNGGIGSMEVDLAKRNAFGVPWIEIPRVQVQQKAIHVDDEQIEKGQVHEMSRSVVMNNYLMPVVWHRIDVTDEHVLKDADGKLIKKWSIKESKKAYTWADDASIAKGKPIAGEEWWTTYRYMVEEFVNKIKGRKGSGVWVDGDDSIKQMEVIDGGYRKAGMEVRPSSTFK